MVSATYIGLTLLCPALNWDKRLITHNNKELFYFLQTSVDRVIVVMFKPGDAIRVCRNFPLVWTFKNRDTSINNTPRPVLILYCIEIFVSIVNRKAGQIWNHALMIMHLLRCLLYSCHIVIQKRLLLRWIDHFESDLIKTWTLCGFRIPKAHQRSIAK